jgi:ABC-type glycerol-3-phosphate transport system permease component
LKSKGIIIFLKYFVLIFVLILFLTPIIFQIVNGFKTEGQIYDPTKIAKFNELSLTSWKEVIQKQSFLKYLGNTLIASLSATFLVMLLAIPAGYGLAKLKMSKKIRSNLSFEFLSMRMLPGIAVIIPIFVIYKKIGLLYTLPGLILLYVVFNIPLAVWLLEGFFKEVPSEIIEAARIDGCTSRQELFSVAIPLSGPGIMSVGILTFIFTWNEYMFASVLTNDATRTLPVWAAFTTYQHYIINYATLGIAATVMIVPVIIFAMLMQKYLVRGLSLGALKE